MHLLDGLHLSMLTVSLTVTASAELSVPPRIVLRTDRSQLLIMARTTSASTAPSLLTRLLAYPSCLWLGLALRLALVAFGSIQDSLSSVPYTDVDYRVYSDAAAEMSLGESPYNRATYRYTPLLSLILLPTVVWPLFGKLIFLALDLLLAAMVREILCLRGVSKERSTRYGALPILLNPLVINLSTRGNADVIIVVLVVAMMQQLLAGRVRAAAILYGLAVHVKIYPIIYAPALVLFLQEDYPTEASAAAVRLRASAEADKAAKGSKESTHHLDAKQAHPKKIAVLQRESRPTAKFFFHDLFSSYGLKLRFIAYSASTFLIITALCYAAYGWEFLYETYLYHVVRVDTRHNFSVVFYQMYLEYSDTLAKVAVGGVAAGSAVSLFTRLLPLLNFVPQLLLLLLFSIYLSRDLPICIFAQTLWFVAGNKVVTAQYFLWWLVPLIVVAPQSRLTWKGAVALGAMWMASEVSPAQRVR
jgi:phosphatidylinositol glycan class M